MATEDIGAVQPEGSKPHTVVHSVRSRSPHIDAQRYAAATTDAQRLQVINDVSYLKKGEAQHLYDVYQAAQSDSVNVLEIGARYGCSTMALALAAQGSAGMVLSIDPHHWSPAVGQADGSLEILRDNLVATNLHGRVVPVLGTSWEIGHLFAGKYRMLWIDGDHSEKAVRWDLLTYAHWIQDDGVICGHDYMDEPHTVKDAVDQWAADHGMSVSVFESIWRLHR